MMLIPPYDEQVFRVASYNANHTANNTSIILNTLTSFNALFIQEPAYSVIKHTLSSTNPNGDALYGTQALAREWILLEVTDIRNARVACYVHKRWVGARPRTCHDIISHPHLLCFSLTLEHEERFFLNVYSHSTSHDATNLLLHTQSLPQFTVIASDFNLHHHAWDSVRASEGHAEEIIHLMPDLDVSLLNQIDVPTHFPHNRSLSSSVIDLV